MNDRAFTTLIDFLAAVPAIRGEIGHGSDDEGKKGSTENAETDPKKAALAIWNDDEEIRAEFAGQEKAFIAYYEKNPEEFE